MLFVSRGWLGRFFGGFGGIMKEYIAEFEIAGNAAMWTRPDTGVAPVSYPAPTFSAIRVI